jgi:hypothetical protein
MTRKLLLALAARLAVAVLVASVGLAGCSNSTTPAQDVILPDTPVGPDIPMLPDIPVTPDTNPTDVPQPDDIPQPTDTPIDLPPPPDLPPPVDMPDPDLNVDMASGEICDNGSDDDGDGFTDCQDRECSGANSGTPAANCDRGTVKIQDIQDGTTPSGMATVSKVFVTALRVSGTNGRQLYVQEAAGETTAGHTYPEYAGIAVFIPDSASGNFPNLGTIAVGDCVTIKGVIEEFRKATQLTFIQTLTKETSGCGTAPTASVISFADIASDTNADMGGRQPGANAERYEGVLVAVEKVIATSATSAAAADGGGARNSFFVSDGTDASLFIDNFLFTPRGPITYGGGTFVAETDVFSTITGIYNENDNGYFLAPRDENDITP